MKLFLQDSACHPRPLLHVPYSMTILINLLSVFPSSYRAFGMAHTKWWYSLSLYVSSFHHWNPGQEMCFIFALCIYGARFIGKIW